MLRVLVTGLIAPQMASAGVSLREVMPDAEFQAGPAATTIELSELKPGGGWAFEPVSGLTWGIGESSTVQVSFSPSKQILSLRGRPFLFRGVEVQWVEVVVDGQLVRRLHLVPWIRTYRVQLPTNIAKETNTQLTLRYRWSNQPREVLSSSTDSRELAVQWKTIRLAGQVPPTSRFEWVDGNLEIVGTQRLRVPLRVRGPVTFSGRVLSRASRGLNVTLEDDQLNQADQVSGAKESPVEVILPGSDQQRFVRLTLEALPQSGWWYRLLALGKQPRATLQSPTIEATDVTWPTLEIARMETLSTVDPRPQENPPSVFLWVVDTLRADHLGVYGYSRDTSPNLDAFAREAVVFTNAVAQSSWTRPSVTSILTGQYLSTHGVFSKDHALGRKATTMAESLSQSGYATAAFVTNGNLRHVGLEQGFRKFEHFKEGRVREFHHPADRVVDAVLAWLDRHRTEVPFAVYAHLTDPHTPYIPVGNVQPPWSTADPEIGSLDSLRKITGRPNPPVQDLVDLYDAEIRQVDASFLRFTEGLRQRGLADSSILIVTADHGEEFLDHGGWQHGRTLFSEQLRVPLIVRWPQGQPTYSPGSTVENLVSHVDILPTILNAAGRPVPSEVQGSGLDRPGNRPTVAELDNGLSAVLTTEFKLIADLNSPTLLLFHRSHDPGDTTNLALTHHAPRDYLLRLKDLLISDQSKHVEPAKQDAETLEQLRTLGYLN